MAVIEYGRLNQLEAALGGREAIEAAFLAGKTLISKSIADVHVVASDAAMLAIPDAHEGTVAVRTDLNNAAYMNNGGTSGTDTDWTEIGFVNVVSVNGKTGVVTLASNDLSDSAALERLVHKGAANGYMGLDGSARGAQSPKLHRADHATGGADAITPADIGAAIAAGAVRLLSFPFAYNTSGILTGIPVGYTPAVGDVLIDFAFIISTAWNGTTPSGDLGQFNTSHQGLGKQTFNVTTNMAVASTVVDGALANASGASRMWRFTASAPLLVAVSQDGTNTGANPGSTQGAARLNLLIATPS